VAVRGGASVRCCRSRPGPPIASPGVSRTACADLVPWIVEIEGVAVVVVGLPGQDYRSLIHRARYHGMSARGYGGQEGADGRTESRNPKGSRRRTSYVAGNTKGALRFHFRSKCELADAVLDRAEAAYTAIVEWCRPVSTFIASRRSRGWSATLPHAYDHDIVVRAEFKLTLETEFDDRDPTSRW
jgi:hypothetical protein